MQNQSDIPSQYIVLLGQNPIIARLTKKLIIDIIDMIYLFTGCEQMRKIIISIIIALLVVATSGAVMVNINNRREHASKLADLSERHLLLNVERRNLIDEKNEYVSLRADETRSGNYLVLFFDNVDENLIKMVYPMLNKYGYKGTIVLCEGLVPGEVGNISKEDFDFLLANGWDIAIGYNSEIDMSAKDAPELLGEYLDSYMQRLTQAGIEIPITYCFNKGEYNQRFEPVLKERGFKAIRHYGETGDVFGSAYIEDEFYYIGAGICCAASSKLQANVDLAYQNDLAYGMSVRYIADVSIDTKVDCTTTKYDRMLSYLKSSCPGTVVCTMSDLYSYKQQQLISAQGIVGEYNSKIQQFESKIAAIDEEIADIISQLN